MDRFGNFYDLLVWYWTIYPKIRTRESIGIFVHINTLISATSSTHEIQFEMLLHFPKNITSYTPEFPDCCSARWQ